MSAPHHSAPTDATPARRRFTADEVFRMVEAGILGERERVELLDGELVEMSPQGVPHVSVLSRLNRMLVMAYPAPFAVLPQCTLAAGEHDLPEPDFSVYGSEVSSDGERPTAAHTVLVIEIAVTSQRRDRWKAGLYARAGAPEYWILDVPGRTLTVHRQPVEGQYTRVEVLRAGDEVQVPALEQRWAVASLLP